MSCGIGLTLSLNMRWIVWLDLYLLKKTRQTFNVLVTFSLIGEKIYLNDFNYADFLAASNVARKCLESLHDVDGDLTCIKHFLLILNKSNDFHP